MPRPCPKTTIQALLAVAALALIAVAPAGAATLEPRGKKIFFGISDTGDPADFGGFSEAMDKHPALIQTFRTWGTDFPESIERWQEARARPMLHITTADNDDGHELISLRGIAEGDGDDYLVRLNKLFWAKKLPAYIRPLGEPNRCINVYAAYDCAGKPRGGAHSPRQYKRAFRRVYLIVHGGGRRAEIDARLAEAGLPPLRSDVTGLPKAPVAVLWSTLPAGSPTVPRNRPRHFYPGSDYVDWVGTDVYSDNQDWKALAGLYRRYGDKPFALPEWGVSSGDDPTFVRKLLTWVDRHRRCKMLVYYQDFGSSNSYRLQNYPRSRNVITRNLRQARYPALASNLPPPPPPGTPADPSDPPPPPTGGTGG
jgi:hypothetical protein